FCTFDFSVRNRLRLKFVDLLEQCLDGVNRCLTLCSHCKLNYAGMVEARANSADNSVGQSLRGANVLNQARGESSAECFIENLDCVVIGIAARSAKAHHANPALIHVVAFDEVVAGFRGSEL